MISFSSLFKKYDDFGIVVSQNDKYDILGVQHYLQVHKLDIDNLLKPSPLLTQADPFLLVNGQSLYLFFESERSGERGIIRMIKTDNLNEWTAPVTVLQEPFHLSFPFVFEYCGEIYMIPESQSADSVRLYKGNKSLTQFTFERVILTKHRTADVKFSFCDSHLIEKGGTFFLFTSVSYNWTYHLELYYTDDIVHHDFVKHPASPVYIGNDFGRSGGSIIHLDENYYRISQNCSNNYGGNISIHRIIVLDEKEYQEELYKKDILQTGGKIYRDGGHQLNVVKYGNRYIYATDFRKASWCWYQLYLRLKNVCRKKADNSGNGDVEKSLCKITFQDRMSFVDKDANCCIIKNLKEVNFIGIPTYFFK